MMKLGVVLLLAFAADAAVAAKSVAAADQAETAAGKQDKIICKSYPQIGSLIATQKVCHTKREWENGRANLTMKDPLGSCNGAGGEASSIGGSFCGDGF